ncbi:MAG TPA: class I SAM-dependent methyltransferase [Thermoleophilaceae bacterium]
MTALGRHWAFNLVNDPKRLAFVLARYAFAARTATAGRSVLELGCSEGIGAPLLAERASSYTGVDLDEDGIRTARANWPEYEFHEMDFLGQSIGCFGSIVSLDVIEHIQPEHEGLFFRTVADNLADDGVCVIGTPNLSASAYASPLSQEGHVNLYDAARLAESMNGVFHTVLSFGMNDETLHTGYAPMSHYLLVLGCFKRQELLW